MHFSDLASLTDGRAHIRKDRPIQFLLIDSRKAVASESALFFAIPGERHDGHRFLDSLYLEGVRQFVTEAPIEIDRYPEANILEADSSLQALQRIAAAHRKEFNIPVIAVTGSNGKTIVKEWLSQTLAPHHQVAKNPGSYNSQVGVALSVWSIQSHHSIGVFEGGISQPGEMEKLEKIIQPSLGIFTNIGSAHDEGFSDRLAKAMEKAKLFIHCNKVIYCKDHPIVHRVMTDLKLPSFTWGYRPGAHIMVQEESTDQLRITFQDQSVVVSLPFRDAALRENALHVAAMLILLGFRGQVLEQKLQALNQVPMRLELKQGINRCLLIDDSYNNDLGGIQIALDFLRSQQKARKTFILSDVLQSGMPARDWINQIKELVQGSGITRWIGIGPSLHSNQDLLPGVLTFASTKEFIASFPFENFNDEVILIKGARPFAFEEIVKRLQQKVHGTVMEIDLDAMVHNLNAFRARLTAGTKLMVMVKAFAYGSGSEQVANLLQFHRVDYLGVAYADEGADLRKNNIALPIMVMNPSEESFPVIMDYRLEPEVYNVRILQALIDFLQGRPCRVHLKLDTGMHRLGIERDQLPVVLQLLKQHSSIRVISLFSHLSGADEALHDAFSQSQAELFVAMADEIEISLGYKPLRHLLNSSGVLRLPQYQFDMVRLGIGLYGVDPTDEPQSGLHAVSTLKTVISQIKEIKPGDTIGYGRRGKADARMTLATVAIGYADGYSRSFSRGAGKMLVRGNRAPVVGNVCMDMTMLDVTGLGAQEGDEVIVFGPSLPITEVSGWINTIPYELLTATSERVKRIFLV